MASVPWNNVVAGGLVAALMVGAGALLGRRVMAAGRFLLASTAGLLLLAAILALGIPAARHLAESGDFLETVLPLAAGILLGAGGGQALNHGLQRFQAAGPGREVLGLAMHNLPEGLGLGALLAAGSSLQGGMVLAGLALHNLLEGAHLREALPSRSAGWALLAGSVELAGALAGAWLASLSPGAFPWMLMITAGALIEVVRAEILPVLRR